MKILSIGLLALLFVTTANAQTVKFNAIDGIAIKGYDPVAYFNQNKAVQGSDTYSFA